MSPEEKAKEKEKKLAEKITEMEEDFFKHVAAGDDIDMIKARGEGAEEAARE